MHDSPASRHKTILVVGLLLLVLFTHGPSPILESPTLPGSPTRIDASPALMQWRVRQDEPNR